MADTTMDILTGATRTKEVEVKPEEVKTEISKPAGTSVKTIRAGRYRYEGKKYIFGVGETLEDIPSGLIDRLKENGFI
jgi:hypothetical protein